MKRKNRFIGLGYKKEALPYIEGKFDFSIIVAQTRFKMRRLAWLSVFLLVTTSLSLHRKLEYERAEWEDSSLPFPNMIHDLERLPPSSRKLYHGRRTTSELTPLYTGYGTHYSFVYVGTPPQRQSVIIDTGSHHTAFPCTGCSQCGTHTDSYWEIKNSSTAKVEMCKNAPCQVSQSYSEGSMWKGYKVMDKLWVGGVKGTTVANGSSYAVDFSFACQTFETGLFRTQLEEGIMGMAIAEGTLPSALKSQGITDTRIFALCYHATGGVMTLGGVDQRIHSPNQVIQYSKLHNVNGWYGVSIVDVAFVDRKSGTRTQIPGIRNPNNIRVRGAHPMRRCIVDSGTTDTYFPTLIAGGFKEKFKQITGIDFTDRDTPLSTAQLEVMPDVVFTFDKGNVDINQAHPVADGDPADLFEITMSWRNYVDPVGGNKYAFRIYLNEPSGFLLGANFMMGQNIIFDADGGRVGFVKSECKSDFASRS